VTTLHLIRHGRASALEADYDQLHPLGELQARLLGEHLAKSAAHFDGIYVGPLQRQLATLRFMREAAAPYSAGWPAERVLPGLAEGPFESLMRRYLRPRIKIDPMLQVLREQLRSAPDEAARADLRGAMFDRTIQLWRGGELAADELEPASAFEARVLAAKDEIVAQQGPGRSVAVITSNGVITLLLQALTGVASPDEAPSRLYNTSVSVLELLEGGAKLHGRNLTEHLTDPEHLTTL
jgi:broad specificity phosphatase PhoE